MLQYDFENSIGYWVILTAHALQKALNEQLMPHGITFRQSQVLGWLALEGELSQRELAERMMIEPPTLVGILDRMERDGWIERTGCSEDRRRKLIRARPEAEAVWDQIANCARRIRARATQGLSTKQTATLMDLLKVVQRNIGGDEPALAKQRMGVDQP